VASIWISPFQIETANSNFQTGTLVSSRIVISKTARLAGGRLRVPNSRVPPPTQPRGKGETLRPGAALGNRGTRGVDAVELEATGGSRPGHSAAATAPLRLLRVPVAQRGGNYEPLAPLPCPCSCGPRRLGRLSPSAGLNPLGSRFRWVSATRSDESPDSMRRC